MLTYHITNSPSPLPLTYITIGEGMEHCCVCFFKSNIQTSSQSTKCRNAWSVLFV